MGCYINSTVTSAPNIVVGNGRHAVHVSAGSSNRGSGSRGSESEFTRVIGRDFFGSKREQAIRPRRDCENRSRTSSIRASQVLYNGSNPKGSGVTFTLSTQSRGSLAGADRKLIPPRPLLNSSVGMRRPPGRPQKSRDLTTNNVRETSRVRGTSRRRVVPVVSVNYSPSHRPNVSSVTFRRLGYIPFLGSIVGITRVTLASLLIIAAVFTMPLSYHWGSTHFFDGLTYVARGAVEIIPVGGGIILYRYDM